MSEFPGLATWSAAIANRQDIEAEAYARLIAHPRFADACIRSAQNWLGRVQGSRVVAQLAMDVSCVFYSIFTLYLDARGELTLAGMKRLCAETGRASAGRAAALMLQLRILGYVVRDPAPGPGRSRRLIPEPAMHAAIREAFRHEVEAFALIEPEALAAAAWLDDPEIFRRMILIAGDAFIGVARREEPNVITPFAAHNAGMAILYQVATSGREGDVYPPRGPVRLSVKDLAQRFGVSRTHVLRLMRKVEALGLIRRNADEATGVIDDKLREGLTHMHAVTLLGVNACLLQARQAVDAEATQPAMRLRE